jgi:hypothetical protein
VSFREFEFLAKLLHRAAEAADDVLEPPNVVPNSWNLPLADRQATIAKARNMAREAGLATLRSTGWTSCSAVQNARMTAALKAKAPLADAQTRCLSALQPRRRACSRTPRWHASLELLT